MSTETWNDENPYEASRARYFVGTSTDDDSPEGRRAWVAAAKRWMRDPDFVRYGENQTPLAVLMFRMGCHG